jgi:hypothetical protein
MLTISMSCLLAFSAATLLAADGPDWSNKPIPQWNDQDAREVLTNSPWNKNVRLEKVRNLSKFERRDGGNMEDGIGPAVGFAAMGMFGPERAAMAIGRAHAQPNLGTVEVRWESASPVRAAEQKLGEVTAPTWTGDYYAIAVHNIPAPYRWNLARELKGIAYLRRDKKKDLKPSRVQIIRNDDGRSTVVYLFSRSAEITRKDRNLLFVAQIGRLFVSQFFFTDEMQLQGEPEL